MTSVNEKVLNWIQNPTKQVSTITRNQLLGVHRYKKTFRDCHVYIVCAVIFNEEGEVLLIQEAKKSCYGKWYLPAGRVEKNENLEEAIRRECKEEAGIDFQPTAIVRVDSDGSWFRFTFVGEIIGGQLKSLEEKDNESLQAKFIKQSQLNNQYILRVNEKVHALVLKNSNDFPIITFSGDTILSLCGISPCNVRLNSIGVVSIEFSREQPNKDHGLCITMLYQIENTENCDNEINVKKELKWQVLSENVSQKLMQYTKSQVHGVYEKLG
ncbi:DgyrCDS4795 [Dimorphilus gyrociliatus]|uniref:DgyrCDS4795 n=1 Tax=Dimorphilus gyrociliatus TaxID=2664684 RepID=A0A7I8VMQ9_9ANNE|nr:DgyrCDS4795 [Dimorphilus gyrociliatus]